ncbi:MAG: hypothetical protein GQ574_22450 [Crocinitomix sp.]|nr:hypothetical protein [Crocinitomix sp.]
MSISKKLKGFKKDYCTTLIPEPNSNAFFVKIPVTDYNELSIIRINLLSAVDLIARYIEMSKNSDRSEISHTLSTLIQLLRNFGLEEECEGLTTLLKQTQLH